MRLFWWLSQNIFLKIGAFIFLFGCGPLLLIILLLALGFNVSDNPIGLGLLFFVSMPTAVIFLAIGAVKAINNSAIPVPAATAATTELETVTTTSPTAITKPELTANQMAYIHNASWGGCWGFMYYLYMNAPQAYIAHLPANFFYTNIIFNGRRQVWESGVWTDFERFAQRNQQIDSFTKPLMLVCFGILFVLIFVL